MTTFHTVANGDASDASHSNQFIAPINNLESGSTYWAGTTTGTSAAYLASLTSSPLALTAGTLVSFLSHIANTGAASLNLNGLGALPILRRGTALAGGEMPAGFVCMLVNGGTSWGLMT